jgi:predicted nucleotidyltransferase
MSVPKDLLRENKGLSDWNIIHAYRGSIAHGTYRPNTDPHSIDDKDTIAICVPDKQYYFGLKEFGSRGTQEIKRDEWDIVIYEIRKGISLLSQGNPNILSLLWLDKKNYINITKSGQKLVDNRNLFIGKHVYRSFTGYAYSQLHKMENCAFEGYMGEKRKRLVQEFGYDTKNASHLIRLLRMGIEFLTDGELYVEREDASQLLDIKNGKWTLEKVKSESDRLFANAETAYINSKLPEKPDYDKINNLCVEIVEQAWKEKSCE